MSYGGRLYRIVKARIIFSPSRPLTQTSPTHDRSIPEILDWPAEEDRAEDGPARPGEDERHQAVVEDPESFIGKYAQADSID